MNIGIKCYLQFKYYSVNEKKYILGLKDVLLIVLCYLENEVKIEINFC